MEDLRGMTGANGGALHPLSAVVQQMPAGVIIAEAPSGRLLLGNRQMETIWRRPLESAQEVADYAAWRGFHADGRPYAPEEWPLARTVTAGESVDGEEIEIERGDGSRGVICMSSSPLVDDDGRVTGAVATAFDITERRSRERTRRFLSEATAVLAASLDYETTLRNVARLAVPTLADWCNIDILRPNGTLDRLAVEHVDPQLTKRARAAARRYAHDANGDSAVARVLRTGEAEVLPTIADDVLRALAHDDEHLGFLRALGLRSAMLVPLTARGRVLGVMVFISAESGRSYGQEDLAQATELALRAGLAIDNAWLYHESQAANRAKSDFLAVISHELRTPLTAIIGYSELLSLGVPEPVTVRQREQVERIELSAQHLMHLIEEILGLVSLDGGQTQLRAAEVRVGELVHRVEVIIGSMAEAKGLAFSIAIEDPEITVETDADHLVQVILNLLTNAIKFTDRGEVRLDVSTSADELRIEVRDTGVGLSAENRDRVFDPFWQAERPITRKAGGTGLGLTVTQRLLELLGGRIEVESVEGAGSLFRVLLPLRVRT